MRRLGIVLSYAAVRLGGDVEKLRAVRGRQAQDQRRQAARASTATIMLDRSAEAQLKRLFTTQLREQGQWRSSQDITFNVKPQVHRHEGRVTTIAPRPGLRLYERGGGAGDERINDAL